MKVTPAHDPNDYGMGERHGLEKVNIFDETAHVVEGYGEFSGMGRDECRQAVVAWFEEHGLLDHVDDHHHSVMHCYRCDSTLEPWLSEQWFVAVDKLKGPATEAVTSGKVTFHPSRWTQTYLTWMENLKDWCISRQLWWGHRIPVFHCEDCGWEDALMEDTDVCPKCGSHHVAQEEDVLDTWFSSQLWTFATQGWPEHPERLEGHHPTTALVTARDIIALWVARMIMSSTYFLKEIPFKDVVIYATILAKDGTRMSKSKGNGVDPMDLISMYGADAMRFNLLTLVTNNQDVRFDADIDKKTHELLGSPRTESARAFVTKIWNASRFVLGNLDGFTPGEPRAVSQADAWIFSRLAKLSAEVTKDIEPTSSVRWRASCTPSSGTSSATGTSSLAKAGACRERAMPAADAAQPRVRARQRASPPASRDAVRHGSYLGKRSACRRGGARAHDGEVARARKPRVACRRGVRACGEPSVRRGERRPLDACALRHLAQARASRGFARRV